MIESAPTKPNEAGYWVANIATYDGIQTTAQSMLMAKGSTAIDRVKIPQCNRLESKTS